MLQVLDVLIYQITVIHIPSVTFNVQLFFDIVIEKVRKENCANLRNFAPEAYAGMSIKSFDERFYHFVCRPIEVSLKQAYQFFVVDASEVVFKVQY